MKRSIIILFALLICCGLILSTSYDGYAARVGGGKVKVPTKAAPATPAAPTTPAAPATPATPAAPTPPPAVGPTSPDTNTPPATTTKVVEKKVYIYGELPPPLFYIEAGAGMCKGGYLPTEWNDQIKNMREKSGDMPMSYQLNFFLPFGEKTLLGLGWNGTYEKIKVKENVGTTSYDTTNHIHTFNVGLVGKFYLLDAKINKGLYTKIGFGMGFGRIVRDKVDPTKEKPASEGGGFETIHEKWNAKIGWGYQSGFGYSIPLLLQGRFTINPEILYYYSGGQKASDNPGFTPDYNGFMGCQFNLTLSLGF